MTGGGARGGVWGAKRERAKLDSYLSKQIWEEEKRQQWESTLRDSMTNVKAQPAPCLLRFRLLVGQSRLTLSQAKGKIDQCFFTSNWRRFIQKNNQIVFCSSPSLQHKPLKLKRQVILCHFLPEWTQHLWSQFDFLGFFNDRRSEVNKSSETCRLSIDKTTSHQNE